MTNEFANRLEAFDNEYSKLRAKQHELDEIYCKHSTDDTFAPVLEQRKKVNDFVREFRKELYSAYKNGECTLNEYFDALSVIGIPDHGLSIAIIDGIETEIGICRDHATKRLRLYGWTHDDLDEYGYDTPTAIRGQIEYLEHELEEAIKLNHDSQYARGIRTEIEAYKEDLSEAIEKEESEFVDKKKALELAAFFTRLANEL